LIKKRYEMTFLNETSGERDLRRLRALYRALGDETRLRVIGVLAEFGPMPVNELVSRVSLSQPLISWHLRIMRLAGLIETHRQGRAVICRLRTDAFEELHAKLVAEWPDGKLPLDGTPTSGCGSGNLRGGRSRPTACRIPYETQPATRSPATTNRKIEGRRQSSVASAATITQISPLLPRCESAMKKSFSQCAR